MREKLNMATFHQARRIRLAGLVLLGLAVACGFASAIGEWKLIFAAAVIAGISVVLNVRAFHERTRAKIESAESVQSNPKTPMPV